MRKGILVWAKSYERCTILVDFTKMCVTMQVVSRVLFHYLLLSNISTIDLCDLPIAAPDLHQNKTGRLNYRNLFGLSTPEVYPT